MFLALREIKHAKGKFTMIGLIIVLIAWLVFIISGLGNGLAQLSASSFLKMDADYVVFEEGSNHSIIQSVISEDLVDELLQLDHVENATAIGQHTAIIREEGVASDEDKIDVTLLGVNPGEFFEPEVIEGKPLTESNDLGVIVNESLKEQGIEIGDTLEIEGSTEKMEVVGIVEGESLNHLPVIFTTMEKWRTIHFAAPGSDMGIENPVSVILLQGENIHPDEVNKAIDGIETATKSEAVNGVPGYSAQNATIYLMLAFLVVISIFIIAVFFYVLTLQKVNQFGVMKAIGANNRFLSKAIVSQVAIIAAVSIGVGVALTFLTAMVLPEGMPFTLNPVLTTSFAIGLFIVSILSSLISVRTVTKIDPLQAIGRVE